MITRNEAIATIESAIRDAERRVTKPLRPELAAELRTQSIAAYDESPNRFPTTAILRSYVKSRAAAKLPVAIHAQAGPDSEMRRGRRAKKHILEEMSPGGANALRSLEGD
jgi:hypothetical protein